MGCGDRGIRRLEIWQVEGAAVMCPMSSTHRFHRRGAHDWARGARHILVGENLEANLATAEGCWRVFLRRFRHRGRRSTHRAAILEAASPIEGARVAFAATRGTAGIGARAGGYGGGAVSGPTGVAIVAAALCISTSLASSCSRVVRKGGDVGLVVSRSGYRDRLSGRV